MRQKFVWKETRDTRDYDLRDFPPFLPPTKAIPSANRWDLPAEADSEKKRGEEEAKKQEEEFGFEELNGVFHAWSGPKTSPTQQFAAPTRAEYSAALSSILELSGSGPVRSFCHNRLHLLEARFNLHSLLNHDLENLAQKAVPHRDFYNVRKIDNHVHASAMMNQNIYFVLSNTSSKPILTLS